MTPDWPEVMIHGIPIVPVARERLGVVEELSELQTLILLVLLGAPEGGMDAEQIAVEIKRLTGSAPSINQVIAALEN